MKLMAIQKPQDSAVEYVVSILPELCVAEPDMMPIGIGWRSGAAKGSAGVSIDWGSVVVCVGWVSAADPSDHTTGEGHE